ncbi:MAG: LamG domain-containing protein, partial [Candidatus Undinarchaeales archaeon]
MSPIPMKKKEKNFVALGIIFFIVCILSMAVFAYDFTISTTADFDAGNKSSSSGNYEVETNTDNPVITADEIQLGNKYGDAFNFADADANTWKWNIGYSAGSSDIDTTKTGELYETVSTTGAEKLHSVALDTALQGEFDIQIDFNDLDIPESDMFGTGIYVSTLASGFSNYAGIMRGHYSGFGGHAYYGHSNSETNTDIAATSNTSGKLRIVRTNPSGDTWNYEIFYYDGGWQSLHNYSYTTLEWAAVDADVYPHIFVYAYVSSGTVTCDYDDFKINSGTVSGAYRTAGHWTSAGQTLSKDYLYNITLNFTNVNASNYIDQLKVYNNSTNSELDNTYLRDDANLTSYWKLEGDADDETGINNGTVTGATQVSGKFGDALNFDGDNDYVNVGKFQNTPTFFSAWIKPNVQSGYSGIAIEGYYYGSSKGWFTRYSSSTEKVYFAINNNSGDLTTWDSGAVAPPNKWHHIIVGFDDTNVYIYVNGIEHVNTTHGFDMPLEFANRDLLIGRAGYMGGDYMNGSIDDVAIYNRALSSEEVQDLYDGAVAKYTTDINSGTSETISIYNTTHGNLTNITDNYKIRLYLSGDNSSTPTINSIEGFEREKPTIELGVTVSVPENDTTTTDTTPDIKFKFTDPEDATADCTLYFYNQSDSTAYNESFVSGLANNTYTTEEPQILNDGVYNYWVYCD